MSQPQIESTAARQDTERPKQDLVTDATGKPLRVGDLVIVRATVESVNPDGYGCNLVLRTEREIPFHDGHGPHRSVMHLHGNQVATCSGCNGPANQGQRSAPDAGDRDDGETVGPAALPQDFADLAGTRGTGPNVVDGRLRREARSRIKILHPGLRGMDGEHGARRPAGRAEPMQQPQTQRLESWRAVWRKGIAPQLSDAGLAALRQALITDDPRLVQGATTSPPPLASVKDWPVEGACAIGFCGWQAEGLECVSEVNGYFNRAIIECDQLMGEPAISRWFLNAFDDWPRQEMIRNMLPEVDLELTRRTAEAGAT